MNFDNPHPELEGMCLDGVTPKVAILHLLNNIYIDRFHAFQGWNVVPAFLPEGETQQVIIPRSSILHSNAGTRPASWWQLQIFLNSFGQNGEPHAQIDTNGVLAQMVRLNRRADCNYKANGWYHEGRYYGAHSYETADLGAATLPTTEWSLPQLAAICSALTATCICYRIACTPTPYWNSSGIGHHNQFKEWSIYVGKTCPGAARIRQMDWIRGEVARRLAEYYAFAGGSCPVAA